MANCGCSGSSGAIIVDLGDDDDQLLIATLTDDDLLDGGDGYDLLEAFGRDVDTTAAPGASNPLLNGNVTNFERILLEDDTLLDDLLSLDWSASNNFTSLDLLDLSFWSHAIQISLPDSTGLLELILGELGNGADANTIALEASQDTEDTIVFNNVSGDRVVSIANFNANGALLHDVLDLSSLDVDEVTDLALVEAAGNTEIGIADANGDAITITLSGVTGLTIAGLVADGVIQL